MKTAIMSIQYYFSSLQFSFNPKVFCASTRLQSEVQKNNRKLFGITEITGSSQLWAAAPGDKVVSETKNAREKKAECAGRNIRYYIIAHVSRKAI